MKVTYGLEFMVTTLLVQTDVRAIQFVDLYIVAINESPVFTHVNGIDMLAVR